MIVPHMNIQGTGTPIVLFHGWGFDSQIWCSLLPFLINRYQLYLVDLPGFGLTPQMEWDVFKSLLLKKLPLKFAVIGWSMGGLFATRLAFEEPRRISHLVNIASSPYFIRDTHWPGVEPKVFQGFYQSLASNREQTLQDFIALQLQGQHVELGQIPSLDGLQSGLDLLMNWDLRQHLLELEMPACYMFGRLDAIVPRTTLGRMQALYPQFKYMQFFKAAHAPFLSHPNEFVTVLESFLQ